MILLDDLTTETTDRAVHSIAHSVIHLDQLAPIYGGERRRRAASSSAGARHSAAAIMTSSSARAGCSVFPRLVAAEHRSGFAGKVVQSGIAELDLLLGGGIAAGSSTLILGPAGTGKSLLVLQYITAAVARGERAALFVFDEELGPCSSRAQRPWASTSRPCATPTSCSSNRWTPPSFRLASSSIACAPASIGKTSAPWRSTASMATRPRCRRSSS